ncbi:conserved Plasmodium protein, unknown function [Plasmodium sp. gorilla clade G2]|uniref:conserved Plasmodium protein, unknown function n=1 Tax=Plasmodium sp. gorilla clade G2 TaxID=880535 RepID=UPI000D21FFC5|nr:conserved Plasmodium protein, unknown function [Plasmodium sp. gorilla clade G2]SOV18410.1 conserved Plasmodium protein, unknown function [Plasmodium sp. gorilla clade G2]
MLREQLKNLKAQKNIQVFEDDSYDKISRRKYSSFRNVYKNFILSSLHIESVKLCFENLKGLNKSFEEFEKLFCLEEGDMIDRLYNEDEKENNEIYLKHREFLTKEENKYIFEKIKLFLKLCSLYCDRKEIKILLEFLIYKYEINVKCSQDILLCLLPILFNKINLKNILEILYIQKDCVFVFFNNCRHDDLVQYIDKAILIQNIKKNINIYKIIFNYIIDLIGYINMIQDIEIYMTYINFFISISEDIIHSYINIPISLIEFYFNILLSIIKIGRHSFHMLNENKVMKKKINITQKNNNEFSDNMYINQINISSKFLNKFYKLFEMAIQKKSKEITNFHVIKNNILTIFEKEFIVMHDIMITNTSCSDFIKSLILLLNIIYKYSYNIHLDNYINRKQVKSITDQYEYEILEKRSQKNVSSVKENIIQNGCDKTNGINNSIISSKCENIQLKKNKQQGDIINLLNENLDENPNYIINLIDFVKNNKYNLFDNEINNILQKEEMILNFVNLFCDVNNVYEITDNLIKIIFIKSYYLKINISHIECIFYNIPFKNKNKNHIFNIILIINLISYYIFLIKKEHEKDEKNKDKQFIPSDHNTQNFIKDELKPNTNFIQSLIKKCVYNNNNNTYVNKIINHNHFFDIIKYYMNENNELFKKKIILFETYSKIDEGLILLLNISKSKMNHIPLYNILYKSLDVDTAYPNLINEVLKNIKFIYDYKMKVTNVKALTNTMVYPNDIPTDNRNNKKNDNNNKNDDNNKNVDNHKNDDDNNRHSHNDAFLDELKYEQMRNEHLTLGLINKGNQFLKSKRHIESLYNKVIFLLKENKSEFIDNLKYYEKELLYFFPSKKYMYKILFKSFNELKLENFIQIDKERNTLFLKFYIKVFMVKMKKLQEKYKKDLMKDKFFKKFINFNFSFFFIIYDYIKNSKAYPEHSYFSRNIASGNFKLIKKFFLYLSKLRNIEYQTFEQFFENEIKHHRLNNIKIIIKYSNPFRSLILYRIINFFTKVDLFKVKGITSIYVDENGNILKLNTNYNNCFNILTMERQKESFLLNNNNNNNNNCSNNNNNNNCSNNNNNNNCSNNNNEMCSIEKDQNNLIPSKEESDVITYNEIMKRKKELKIFLMKIFKILLNNINDRISIKSDMKNANVYMNILKAYQKNILLFVNYDITLTTYLYYKYLNIFYISNTYSIFILDTLNYYFYIYKAKDYKKFIKNNNMCCNIVIELYRHILKNKKIKIDKKTFYQLIIISILLHTLPDRSNTNRMVYMWKYMNRNLKDQPFFMEYDIMNKFFFEKKNINHLGNFIFVDENKTNLDKEKNDLIDKQYIKKDNIIINNIDQEHTNFNNSYNINMEENFINEKEQDIIYSSNEYYFDYRYFITSGKVIPSRNNIYKEVMKYYLFIFAYFNKHFFDIFISNFYIFQLQKCLILEFLDSKIILIFLKRIMKPKSYPYKITQIYKHVLYRSSDVLIKEEHIFFFLHLIDYYINVLENNLLKTKSKINKSKINKSKINKSKINKSKINKNKINKNNISLNLHIQKDNHTYNNPDEQIGKHKDDNIIPITNNNITSNDEKKKYINKKLFQPIYSINTDINLNILRNDLNNKKIKKIKYTNLLNEEYEESVFFGNLKGFFKYHENLFEDIYFIKEKDIRYICELIINIIINSKMYLFLIQLLCIKNFSISSLFNKNVLQAVEELEITNMVLFKKLFLNKKTENYNSILLMCKNVKNLKEKNKIILFMEKQINKKNNYTNYNKLIKILHILSEQTDDTNEDNTLYHEYVNTHIRIFKRISNYLDIYDSIFIKLIKYITNITTLIYQSTHLIAYHFSLHKNNFFSYMICFFQKNVNYLYENICLHLEPLSSIMDKIIKKKIYLYVIYERKQMNSEYSNSKKRKTKGDVIKQNKLLDQLKGSHIDDSKDDVFIDKENDNSDDYDTLIEQTKKRKLENNNNKKNDYDCDDGGSSSEDNSYNNQIDKKNINSDNNNNNNNKIYDQVINNNSKNTFIDNNFMNYYHLHIFAFICTSINTIFKNEIDIKKFTVLTNNLIFLFNKCYSSYVVSICLINLIIKIRLDKLYDCKNYILEIFNIYNYDDVDYCINNNLLLLLALYLCPQSYKKNILLDDLKTQEEQNIDSHIKSINNNNNVQMTYNESYKNVVYPYYVYSKLKYIKPHLKKVTNIHNLCLKLISLISIIHNVNEKAIKPISYFIYFSTFQNFILCFTFAQDKLINRKLNLLYKKFTFQNTDTFVLIHLLNNFKVQYELNTQEKINKDQIEDNINNLQYHNIYHEKKNAINDQIQKLIKKDHNDIETYSHLNLSNFENSYLYKFLFHLNKLKDYMTFNDGFQKYKRFKQNKNNNENKSIFPNDDILENKYFVYDIFCDILNCEPDNNIQLFKRNMFLFYEYLMDKLYHLNFVNNKNLLKEIIIFINQKLNKEMDCKYIFDAVMYSLCNKKEIIISPLNELYINNIFNKSLFNIKLDDSMKIFIISKINQMLSKLFKQYYQVSKNEKNKINKFNKSNNHGDKNGESMEANQNDENGKKHVEQEENSSINNKNNINSNSISRKHQNMELKTNKDMVYQEIDIIYEEYKKYNEQFGSDILLEPINQNDTTLNNTFDDDDDIYISDVNSINSDYNFDEEDNSYNLKYKDLSNNMENLNNTDIINIHNNTHKSDTLNNNDVCIVDNLTNIFNDEEVKDIKFINKLKDLKKIFGIDSYYMNNILKCIATLLINFPIITKNKMIELFHVMFLNNKKYILINTKNLLVEYFYSLSNEKKINYLRKIITNPLKKLDYNHIFFIFSNNHMNICLKHLIKYYQKQRRKYILKNNDSTYNYNGSVVMNNCLFYYQQLIVYENLFHLKNKKGKLGFNFLFALIKNYIKNCKTHITYLYNKHKQNIKYLNSEEFHCYSENTNNRNSLIVDLRAEEQNIVTSLLYTSTKMKVNSLSKLFDNLISCFENKIFESTSSNILDNYKTTYEKRIYYIFFYRLYKNFGSVLNSSNKYLYDLLNNIKFTLISCQKNSQDIFQLGKNHTYNKYMQNGQVQKIKNKLGDQFDDNTYYDNTNESPLNESNEELQDIEEEKGLILNNKHNNNNNNNNNNKNNLRCKWYWFDLGYPTLMCLYEILKSEKNNQTNVNPIFFNTCFDDVINYFNIFQHLPRIHINDQFENNINEKILTNSELYDMKMVSIILLDMLKLILCRYYNLYLNDPEKIQIMTMRLSLKNSDNHINSYNITICIILTLKYIYETIGYNQLLFSVKDLYQIFSELNNHPDDEIEYISKQWFNTIRKNSEIGNV